MKDIETCSICGTCLQDCGRLKFYELLGSGSEWYEQRLGVCPKCGLIVTKDPFTPEQLENRYKKESKFEYDNDSLVHDATQKIFPEQSRRQKFFIDVNIQGDYESVLEVGAASGYNLSLYKDKTVFGIEPSETNCRLARGNYGVELFPGMWSEFYQKHGGKAYDLVFLSMVLEHIVNPYQFIKECREFCKKYIFIYVPTLDYQFVEEPFGLFGEEHVNIFTLEGLHSMMHAAGFSLMDAEMVYGWKYKLPAGFPAIMTLWKKGGEDSLPLPDTTSTERLHRYWTKCEERLAEINEKIERIPATERLALWGVGHHVSMLLANTCLREKNIVAILDSDERKTGIPIMGHPITPFSKVYMDQNDVDAILITTYTAQDAILRQLKTSGYQGKVYTLYQ